MAADTVDAIERSLGRRRLFGSGSRTERLHLHGGDGVDAAKLDHLGRRYGSDGRVIRALVDEDPDLGQPLVPSLPYVRAEALYAVRDEMATTLEDVLSRRTRALLLGRDAAARAAADVAALIAPELGWSAAETAAQVDDFRRRVAAERDAAGLPETALDASIGA